MFIVISTRILQKKKRKGKHFFKLRSRWENCISKYVLSLIFLIVAVRFFLSIFQSIQGSVLYVPPVLLQHIIHLSRTPIQLYIPSPPALLFLREESHSALQQLYQLQLWNPRFAEDTKVFHKRGGETRRCWVDVGEDRNQTQGKKNVTVVNGIDLLPSRPRGMKVFAICQV